MEGAAITPDQTLDVKGAACPIPVVKTAKTIKTLEPGAVLEVLATDPGVEPDMQAWTKQTGNELISIDEQDGVFRVLLRKAA
jgi:tRNA 2-thiouridine synthesizing protein A